MTVADRIDAKLRAGLAPERLEIKDESHLHAGHAGARPDGESHFRLFIVTSKFDGLARVERQRLVNSLLRDELAERIHALAMKTLTPAEYEREAAQSR
ncbi:MAG: BolA family protein [Parvularculaceae bacterium]|nr:BolA family transcriptional regulator [Parvularculaceae bacterium]